MADRTVSVELVAKTEKYTVPVIAAKDETEKLDNKVEALNRDLDKTAGDAAKAAASLKLLGGDAGGLGEKLRDIGPVASTSMGEIDKQIQQARTSLKAFAEDFNKTGSSTSLAGMIGAKDQVSELEKLKKDLSSALTLGAKEGEKAISSAISTGGQEGSKSLLSSLQGVLSTPVLGPITVGAIAAAVVATAPAIGAAIGAAVIGGTGLGLIGLGIAGQIHSPAVVSALDELKAHATDDLTGASSVFGPTLVGGLHTFTDELDKIAPDVQRNISKIAGPAQHLFEGAAAAVDRLGPGIGDLSSAAAPFVDVLAAELPHMADAFSQMFHDISANAPGAIMFFHDLFTGIDILIVATGKFASAMEKAYGWAREVADIFGGHPGQTALGLASLKGAQDDAAKSALDLKTNMEVAGASVDIAGGKAMSASDQYGMLVNQLNAVNNTADTVAGAMSDKLLNSMMASDQATLHFDESLTKVSTNLTKGKDSLNEHTAAGQKNIGTILGAVQANIQTYDTNIKAGMSATDAAAAYDKNTQALEAQLRKAGLTQSAIDGLIGKYKSVPDNVNTDIAMNGLTDAINNLADLERAINGIPKLTIITIEEQHRTSGSDAYGYTGHATGAIRRAAFGAIFPPRDPGTLIGEPQTGGEALIPLQGISPMRAAALGQVAMAGYGLDVVPRGYRSAGGGSGGATTINLNATFIDPTTGETTRKQLITWALNRGMDPATDLFPSLS